MALLRHGILGDLSGQVAGVVGTVSQGRNVLRPSYFPTGAPSTAQLAQREKVQNISDYLRGRLSGWLESYLSIVIPDMSARNWFLKQNLNRFAGPRSSWSYPLIVHSTGSLWPSNITYWGTNGTVFIVYGVTDNSLGTNGLLTDSVFCWAYNETSGIMSTGQDPTTRATAYPGAYITWAAGDVVHFWLWWYRLQSIKPYLLASGSHYHKYNM